MSYNNILNSLELRANGLDFSGNLVGDANIKITDLSELPYDMALEYYNKIKQICDELHDKVLLYKDLNAIENHEKKINILKINIVKRKEEFRS